MNMGEGYYQGMEATYSKRIDELMVERDKLLDENKGLKKVFEKAQDEQADRCAKEEKRLIKSRDEWRGMAESFVEDLESIYKLDRTPEYKYGECDRQGYVPDSGQRWKTPKEISKKALADYSKLSGDEK